MFHKSKDLKYSTWLCPCQQYTFIRDYPYSGPPLCYVIVFNASKLLGGVTHHNKISITDFY